MRSRLRHKPTYRLYQETKTKVTSIVIAVAFLASVGSAAAPLLLTQTAAAASNVITPTTTGGWTGIDDNGHGGSLSYVNGPGTAPAGTGSAQLAVNASDQGYLLAKAAYGGTKLSDISALAYSTYVQTGNNTIAPSVQINVVKDVTQPASWQGRLVYEPYMNGTVTDGTWQTWSAKDGKWWLTKSSLFGNNCDQGHPCTFTELVSLYPNIGVNTGDPLVGFKAGSAWNSFVGNVDNFTFNDDTYDFEPAMVAPCTTTNSVVTNDLSTWDLSETRSAGHNAITASGLHVWTEPSGGSYANEFSKAAGYYTTDFALADAGVPDITIAPGYTGVRPSLQLGVDKDGNGTWDGYLVYEPWAYGTGNFWSSKNFGINPGGGYTSMGTLNDYLAANPNSRVTSIGYSLGSGVVGDATITKITAGCVDYTFALDTTPPAVPVHVSPANNSSINYNNFWFDWTDVPDAVSYEVQFSQSNSTDSNGALNVGVWSGDASHNQPTESRAWSSGANGTWYWQVRAVDAAGNKSVWTSPWKLTIDMDTPAVPTNLSWKTSTNIVIPNGGMTKVYDGTASWQDSSSDVDHYVYKYWNDITGNPYKVGSEYTANVSGTSLPGVFNQGEGVHHFCVVAVDAAGNASACSAPFTITYDTTAPSVPVITAPVNGQHFASTPILNKWDASTDNLSGIDHYQVAYLYDDGHGFGGSTCAGAQIDGQTLSGCRDTNGTSRNHVPALTEQGGVTIWVRAYDKAGNVSNWSTPVHYYYDATAPGVPSALLFDNNNNGVADNGYITTQNFHFNLNSSSDVTRYQLKYWNDIPGSPFNGQTNAWSPTDITAAGHMNVLGVYTDLFTQGEGTHHFAFSACDAAGNCSAFSTPFTVTYDATKPTVSVLAPAFGSIKRSPVTVKVNATDNLALKQIMVNVYRGTTVVKSCSTSVITPLNVSSYTLTCDPAVLTRGTYTIKVTATDMAGNVSDITTSTFTVRRPVIPATVTSNNSNTIQITNTNNQTANTGNAGNNGNTNGGNAQTGDANNNNQGVLGATTTNDETSGPETVNFANAAAEKPGKAFGIGWWWILVLVGLGGFFLLLAARRRRKDKQENA